MKKLNKILLLAVVLPFFLITGCKDDDPVPANENFVKLTEYLIANDLDLDNVLDGWITAAPTDPAEVDAFLNGYQVFDIRGIDDYNASHIQGAVHSSLETIIDDAANATKPILVACYTGQSAAHAVVALRLSGHPDAKVLKWGMSGWNNELTSPWADATGDLATDANWTTDATASLAEYDYPEWTTNSTDPAEILAERVKVLTDGGFKGIPAADVLANPDNYFINNYWAQADVDHYGHIKGAYRILPLTLKNDDFRHYDPNKTVVTYCWTGQTSSMVTAYLTVLGYNAKSLKFGTNAMIYSTLESHKFVTPLPVDLPLVTE